MYRILFVEDDESVRSAVSSLLTRYGYEVEAPVRFNQLIELFERKNPHLILLDINLPTYDGFHICREIRQRSEVPIIFLSSRDTDLDQVLGMTLGADDYITKPFSPEVLLARISAVLRRVYGRTPSSDTLEHRGLKLDLARAEVSHGQKRLELTRNELKLLHVLLEKRGTVVTREQLMERLWSSNLFIDDNTLTVNIARLRGKLAEIGLNEYIETRRGIGYVVP